MDKIKVTKYTGTIPAGGKQVFKFGAYTLCHRSIKADKSDFLVNVDDGMIIRAYPIGTSRNIILEDIAENMDTLDRYFKHSSRYELVDFDSSKSVKLKDVKVDKHIPIFMEYYSDGSCVHNESKTEKKYYNLNLQKDW